MVCSPAYRIASTPEVDALIGRNAPVAIGVSGGKDSSAVAIATIEGLDELAHMGPRVLVHADLGLTEWRASLPSCQHLAERLGTDLIVVRRAKGGMMERWEQRWRDNVDRYANLECVQLILPWSTPDMRFCTSELKTSPICSELSKRFAGETILSVTGIRRQESRGRAKAPVAKPQPKLASVTRKTSGLDWHPIIEWSRDTVLQFLRDRDFPLHEAYTRYGASRVSCAFCIMSAAADLRAAAGCHENRAIYRRMVDLEIRSTFAFQGSKWLGDIAPDLLECRALSALAEGKISGAARVRAESRIPKHLLYTTGWPTCVPSNEEALLLSEVRKEVATAVGLSIRFATPAEIIDRYEELMAIKANRRQGGKHG
jgi:3'-phosphoadenosine 5'-phosphosulfate sulfotransferase (PAPS reductase)/FAD synthetase